MLNKKTLSIAIVILFVSALTIRATGEVDPTFIGTVLKSTAERGSLTVIQPDGKIIMDGLYEAANGVPRFGFARFNSDGTLDASFNPPEILPHFGGSGPAIRAIGLQSNGKIIIAGYFNSIGGISVQGIARLNADGSYDNTFVVDPSLAGQIPYVWDMEVFPDDRIVFGTLGPGSILKKLLPDGGLDSLFNASGPQDIRRLAIQPDGKVLVASPTTLKRQNADGSLDGGFISSTFSQEIWDVTLQNDGKILVGGQFSAVNGFLFPKIVRINTDGTVDGSFTTTFNTAGYIAKVTVAPDGTIYAGGDFLFNTAQTGGNLYKLNSNGSVAGFNQTTKGILDIDVQTDGKVIFSALFYSINPSAKIFGRLNTNSTTDNTFQPTFGNHGDARKIFVQTDGKILVGGNFRSADNLTRNNLVRFNADGTVDTSFNTALVDQSIVSAIDVQPDGKMIIGVLFNQLEARRHNADGSTDVVFPGTFTALDVKVLSDGKILIGGGSLGTGYYLKRFNANGTLDNTFNVSIGDGDVKKITLQPDGKIIIAGNFTQVNTIPRGRIARLTATGGLDLAFDTQIGANGTVNDAIVQPDGKIIIGGAFSGINFTNRPFLARLNSDGSLDTSYVPEVSAQVLTLKAQPDNKILIGGDFGLVNSTSRIKLARLNPSGTLDLSFNSGPGNITRISDIELQADGKILIGGDFSRINNTPKLGIARLLNTNAPVSTLFDFDGDNKADVSVFRPSENKWYVLRSSDMAVTQQVFAIPGDIPVPADYDGDGKTDFAIFRPSNGDWWSLSSLNGNQVAANWGQSGDIPRPSDFDGDGRADYIVFRPSNSSWYRGSSANGSGSIENFGLTGDKPVIGDFDGDGKSDKAIFRPSTGDWWWQSSLDNAQRATHWGADTDIPAPADFDGDGKTDFAVYRPSTGAWYVVNSGNGSFTILSFGIAEDKPVPADYDGDGKADIAVFRPSNGAWYLLRSTDGFFALSFGVSTDIPVEGAFAP